MSNFGRNNNQPQSQAPAKADAPNKVKFSSVKMSQTKQGSPTIGLYLKREELEKLVALGSELLAAGEDGCKIGVIVIAGKQYDSGYCYVNPKEQKLPEGQNGNQQGNFRSNGNSNYGGGYRKPTNNFGDKSQARSYLQSKRVDDGQEG